MSQAMEAHRRLLEQWRKAMDLVGPGPLDPHFVDAEQAMSGLEARGRWVDLGSGAGFPGVALAALYPEAEVWMVESRQKRAIFLEQVVAQARLTNARVRCQRSEDLPDSSFDGVVSRAYKPPLDFLIDAARLLHPGGRAVLMLGDRLPLPAPPGWAEESHLRYAVPDGSRLRQVLTRLPAPEVSTKIDL